MIRSSGALQVYVAPGATDMRKSINGLSMIVEQGLRADPFSGRLFAFCNRRRTIVKVLYWDCNGFCIWQKRLEKERFRWPVSKRDVVMIGYRELMWLLDGLQLPIMGAHSRLTYTTVC